MKAILSGIGMAINSLIHANHIGVHSENVQLSILHLKIHIIWLCILTRMQVLDIIILYKILIDKEYNDTKTSIMWTIPYTIHGAGMIVQFAVLPEEI